MSDKCNAPVGVFDSGVGGLTVAREIMRNLPEENIVYFGDTARVPYGTKIKRYGAALFQTDHPLFKNTGCQSDRDRLQYGKCLCTGRCGKRAGYSDHWCSKAGSESSM